MHEFTQKRETIHYRYDDFTTPFQEVGQETAGTIGQLVSNTKIWRMIAFFCFWLNLLLSLWLVVLIQTPWIHVKVAEVVGNGYVARVANLNEYVSPNEIQK
jgi:type IV secretory pathway TrbF-like protein